MRKLPLVSFCISTYKRPDFLKSTIDIILNQNYKDIEIVISEDNSDNTSEKIIKSLKKPNIIYHKNKTHLGMVKSFNKAFELSHGKFITILADDDPPTPNMLEDFGKTLLKYPKMKAFWGASYANVTNKKIAKIIHLKKGLNSLINSNEEYGSTKTLKSKQFFTQFFTQNIFPHYLWNAGLVSRDIVEEIGGVPEYNSAHFSDYAYLLEIATKTPFVIINKELATFSLHELNYGRGKNTLEEYKRGVIGFDKIASKLARKYSCQKEYHKFLQDYIIMFLINRLEHFKSFGYRVDPNELFEVYADLGKSIKFLNKRKIEIYVKLRLFYNYPKLLTLVSNLRKSYGFLKTTISDGTATRRPER